MNGSSAAGFPKPEHGVLRISPAGKLDERKLSPDSKIFRPGKNADYFDLGTLLWKRIRENAERLSATAKDPYLRIFPKCAAKFAGMKDALPTAEDLVAAFFSLSAAARESSAACPGWRISLSGGLLHASNGYDPNEIDMADVFALVRNSGDDAFFRDVFRELRELPNLDAYRVVVFDFFWPAGLYQIFPIAEKLKKLGKKVVLNFTRANEQADFTQWIAGFQNNGEAFDFLDAVVVYEDYGAALGTAVGAFLEGRPLPDGSENLIFRGSDGTVRFKKPAPPAPEELFRRFEAYFHSDAKERRIGGKKIATVRLYPYRCYWSSCFFCTINTTHLYAYKNDRSEYLDSCLDYVQKHGIGYLYLADEAVNPDDILEFARKIVERGIDLTYRFRTRFDRRYDEAACELLARSGARYVGIGLECASDRVSELINKGNELTLVEKTKVISAFEKAGIPFHNYAILGLPGETQEEMYETFLFLSKNVRSRDNYTCSPNVFGLNKGSAYEKHGEKFGVKVLDKPASKTSLRLRIEMAKTALYAESQRQFALEIHRQQFLEFCAPESVSGTVPREFWDFVDRTGAFYHLKAFHRKSPYRRPIREILEFADSPTEAVLAEPFRLSEYAFAEGSTVRNLATGHRLPLPEGGNFVPEAWDPKVPLATNLAICFP